MDFGLGQAFGSAVSGSFGLAGSALQYKYQKKLAAQQNQYNIDMWKMQADYNSPQAQMRRLQEAGLNPNLMYGQGNTGNMSQAPQMVTPEAPEISKHLQKLGDLFNIEGLRTQIANRKKAQADAKNAQVDAERNKQAFEGEKQFGLDYMYDSSTGRYVPVPELDEVTAVAFPYARYLRNKLLSENAIKTYLLDPRRQNILTNTRLIGTNILGLQPQIEMLNYESRYKPYSFWIGQGSKFLNSLPLPKIKFGK